ncbi:MAG: heavy-metal-associated domain-containing protein [Chloroflexi bacterium]|jgi:copper chaperone|nr:heavy-metal-associated domain-containing protein [Chloroflexota bacterium]MBT3670450.1 heavy-metal-associated domain-containing protein [Chloroflexota bacterium]MBT4002700.1 heavy-metal-associated domain-containing protein [Chloroflexota bacterium]MBT4304648.1 heavy-metal-associated domain-containing protein [Chloroflexota bacterium]MBT4534217.1 heavy-metal-associated domain-containing protein [Chloroflexota bacterium]
MSTIKYTVPNISCGHCVNTIQMEVGDLAGVESVVAHEDTTEVVINFDDPATEEVILSLLKEINYAPA